MNATDPSSSPPQAGSPLEKIDACEEELVLLSTEVSGVATELRRLRDKGHEYAELLAARDSTISEQDVGLARLHEERDDLQARAVESDARIHGLEHELQMLRTELTEREHAAVALPILPNAVTELGAGAKPTPDRDGAEESSPVGHVRLIATSSGYRFSTSDDECSERGTAIEIDGERFTVASLGRSPLPGDSRRCAFLMAEPGQTTPMSADPELLTLLPD